MLVFNTKYRYSSSTCKNENCKNENIKNILYQLRLVISNKPQKINPLLETAGFPGGLAVALECY